MKIMMILACFIGSVTIQADICCSYLGQTDSDDISTTKRKDDTETSSSPEFIKNKNKGTKVGIAPFPIIFYSPETSLAGGAGAVFTFRESEASEDTRPDNIQLTFIYTLKNQISFQISPDFYFNNQQGEFYVGLGYSNWPTSFFGIGNSSRIDVDDIENLEEEYTSESFSIQPWLGHKVYSHLSLGMTYDFKNRNISEVEDGGQIESKDLVGNEGGFSSGLGPAIIWDTRDNIFSPSEGSWHKAWAYFHREWMGSDFTYEYYSLDLRHYRHIKPDHVLAFQGLGVWTDGDVPFSELPTPVMRGLYQNVLKDQNMFTLQTEYRFPIKGSWSGAAFLSYGDAFANDDSIEDISPIFSGGGGLRYALNKEEKINLRFDLGISPYGLFPYFMIQEAF